MPAKSPVAALYNNVASGVFKRGISDGITILPMQPAQDFKRAYDGDEGPNTGGMGAYSPLPWAPTDIVEDTYKQVLAPMIAEMAARGTPFVGLLYAGLALTDHGTRVIEFNARFGDPETQVLIPNKETSGPFKYSSMTTFLQANACCNASSRSFVTTTPLPEPIHS